MDTAIVRAITVYNKGPGNLGDDWNDDEAYQYREWLAAELQREFPSALICVSGIQSLNTYCIEYRELTTWQELRDICDFVEIFCFEAYERYEAQR